MCQEVTLRRECAWGMGVLGKQVGEETEDQRRVSEEQGENSEAQALMVVMREARVLVGRQARPSRRALKAHAASCWTSQNAQRAGWLAGPAAGTAHTLLPMRRPHTRTRLSVAAPPSRLLFTARQLQLRNRARGQGIT